MRSLNEARGAVLSSLRRWWPELIAAALLVAIGLAGQKDDPLFAFFVAVTLAIGWGMCARHKRLPLHDKLDQVGRDVAEVREILLDGAGDQAQDEGLHLVR